MLCEGNFVTLSDNLKLNATRRDRIESAVLRFETFCRGDEGLSAVMTGAPFLQGSVATHTSVRPLEGDEFDVDVVFPFRLENNPTPANFLPWFVGRLQLSDFYGPRLIRKNRCVRINYAGDFHLDIIPARRHSDAETFLVPARDVDDWVLTDPIGSSRWVQDLNHKSGDIDADAAGRFVRSVRVMKRWRDRFFGDASAPSSILLVTMLGKHEPSGNYMPHVDPRLYPEHPYMAAYLYDMLRLTDSCIADGNASAFQHPTLEEDLGRGWQDEHLELFRRRLDRCITSIGKGIAATTESEAIAYYRDAFGEFPDE